MKTIGLLYSKKTVQTAELGQRIAEAWGEGTEYVDIETARLADITKHSSLILGTPTYFNGELPYAWSEMLPELEGADLSGLRVAVFGTGDQVHAPMSFADGVGLLAEYFEALGAQIVGKTSTVGYSYEQSLAERNGAFLGLVIDWVNQPELTDSRLSAWLEQLHNELAQ